MILRRGLSLQVYSKRQAKEDIEAVYSMGLFHDVNITPQVCEDSTAINPKVASHARATLRHPIICSCVMLILIQVTQTSAKTSSSGISMMQAMLSTSLKIYIGYEP